MISNLTIVMLEGTHKNFTASSYKFLFTLSEHFLFKKKYHGLTQHARTHTHTHTHTLTRSLM